MNFVSLDFIGFLILTALLYFLAPKKWRWLVLLLASYAFYLLSDWRYLAFILVTTVTTFLAGRVLGAENAAVKEQLAAHPEWKRAEKKACREQSRSRKKRVLLITLLLNFGILALLKYYNFFADSVDALLGVLGVHPFMPDLPLLLPLGISFYTFQAAAYVLDLYRDKYAADDSLLRYALFLSWFPQLVQGPIGRHDHLAAQLVTPHDFDFLRLRQSGRLMLWGYFKKAVIADRLAPMVTAIFDGYAQLDGALLFFGALLYGLQIYCDFSGGIDIIRGVSQLFGIELSENFRRPYFSCSISEFWRRWHITLGSWMKDHVFYPLALSGSMTRFSRWLSRHNHPQLSKLLPTCLCSLLVFMLVGLWHGAEWRYLVYGLWNGGIIALSTLLAPTYALLHRLFGIDKDGWAWRGFAMLRTVFLVSIGRFLVRSADLAQAGLMIRRAFTDFHFSVLTQGGLMNLGLNGKQMTVLAVALLILLVVGILQERGLKLREEVEKLPVPLQFMIELAAIMAIMIFGAYGPEYVAADFIYMNF